MRLTEDTNSASIAHVHRSKRSKMFRMCQLPSELLTMIVAYCDGRTQLRLERCSRRLQMLVRNVQRQSTHLDVQRSYNIGSSISFKQFVDGVLRRYPHLRSLNLAGCPVYLDRTNLSRLQALYGETLEALNIAQQHAHPKLSHDAPCTLHNFGRLRSLCIDRAPLHVTNDTVKRALQLPPNELVQRLTDFSLLCNSGYLFRLLMVLKGANQAANELRSVRLGNRSWVTLNDHDFVLLLWFLKTNSLHLREVCLQDFCFASEQNAVTVLAQLLCMRHLQRLQLLSCTVRSLSTTYAEDDALVTLLGARPAPLQHLRTVTMTDYYGWQVRNSDQLFSRVLRKLVDLGNFSASLGVRMIHPDGIELTNDEQSEAAKFT